MKSRASTYIFFISVKDTFRLLVITELFFNHQSLFGLQHRSPSTDRIENYPFEYEPFRRNSDGGYNIGDSHKRKSQQMFIESNYYLTSNMFKNLYRVTNERIYINISTNFRSTSSG